MNTIFEPKHKISLGSASNGLVLLVCANAVLFVLLVFFKVFYFMTATGNVADTTLSSYQQEIFNYFILPVSFSEFIHRPWTLVSYMFTHASLLNFLSNLLWLVAFGYILQSLSGNTRLIPVYLYGGLIGGAVFLSIGSLLHGLPTVSTMDGATTAVMAVAAGATTLSPRYRIFPMIAGGIPLWVLFVVYIFITLSSTAYAGVPYVAAVIFAGLLGFFYIYMLKRGTDYGAWMYRSAHRIDDLFNPDKKYSVSEKSKEQFYRSIRKPFETQERVTPERVDELLDKINNKGYHSLTKAEKDLLKRAGKEG